jgi:hypothetical protein
VRVRVRVHVLVLVFVLVLCHPSLFFRICPFFAKGLIQLMTNIQAGRWRGSMNTLKVYDYSVVFHL